MNFLPVVCCVVGLVVASGVSMVGTYLTRGSYPDCDEAPLNASSVRCHVVVATARTVGVGLFYGILPAFLVSLVLPSSQTIKEAP